MQRDRELLRQQLMLRALTEREPPALLDTWLADPPSRARRGLQAYAAHAGASAERALAASFPTLRALVGEGPFAHLARAYTRAHPPQRGDLAWLGEHLPDFIACSAQLADEPCLGDVARLEWAIARAEQAADARPLPQTLLLLAEHDPCASRLDLVPGTALLVSPHPIVTIWRAHQALGANGATDGLADRFAAVREAYAHGAGERALVWRQGWQVQVDLLDRAECAFVQTLMSAGSLGEALSAAAAAPVSEGFNFEAWLIRSLECGLLLGAHAR